VRGAARVHAWIIRPHFSPNRALELITQPSAHKARISRITLTLSNDIRDVAHQRTAARLRPRSTSNVMAEPFPHPEVARPRPSYRLSIVSIGWARCTTTIIVKRGRAVHTMAGLGMISARFVAPPFVWPDDLRAREHISGNQSTRRLRPSGLCGTRQVPVRGCRPSSPAQVVVGGDRRSRLHHRRTVGWPPGPRPGVRGTLIPG